MKSFLAHRILAFAILHLFFDIAGASPAFGQDRNVSGRDEFSGKTVATSDMAWAMIESRKTNAPRVGEEAPEFSLSALADGQMIRLSDLHRERPVVLILSSWGCDIYRESLGGIIALHNTYGSMAQFAMVYIREAHPIGGFAGSLGRVADPKTIVERTAVAKRCKERLRLSFPVLVDDMDDKVATRWGAWPVRAFVVETDGRIAYAGMQGPWGYLPYRGFQSGNGIRTKEDLLYSQETLEEFLQKRYPAASLNAKPIPRQEPLQPNPVLRFDSDRFSRTSTLPSPLANRFQSSLPLIQR